MYFASILSCSRRSQVETLQIYNVGWPVTTLVGDGCELRECTAWCTVHDIIHTRGPTWCHKLSLTSPLVTWPAWHKLLLETWARGSLAHSLLYPEPGSYGNTGPHPQLPCLAQGSTVSLQLVLDTPVPSRKIYSLTLPSQMIQSGVPTRNLFSDWLRVEASGKLVQM